MTTLREIRQQLGMTQTELGTALGKSLAAVQRWEREEKEGHAAPRIALLAAWALLSVKRRQSENKAT